MVCSDVSICGRKAYALYVYVGLSAGVSSIVSLTSIIKSSINVSSYDDYFLFDQRVRMSRGKHILLGVGSSLAILLIKSCTKERKNKILGK